MSLVSMQAQLDAWLEINAEEGLEATRTAILEQRSELQQYSKTTREELRSAHQSLLSVVKSLRTNAQADASAEASADIDTKDETGS